jgi:hypothetical protein
MRNITKNISTTFILLFFVVAGLAISDAVASSNEYVKLSSNGVCHNKASAFYERTKNFKMYASMANCIAVGGRPAKGSISPTQVADNNKSGGKYNRKDWKHWSDFDGDCQDTRAEVLISQSSTPVKFDTSRGCRVTSGTFYDPYSGRTFTNDDDVDIDHIIALGYSSARGGSHWSAEKKEQFANDPLNLIAVDRSLNRAKGAAGITEWLPPNHSYRCEYIERFEH